jgi:hypothetical protein
MMTRVGRGRIFFHSPNAVASGIEYMQSPVFVMLGYREIFIIIDHSGL